mmetsp:Transcript_7858/g.11655  ORF Transcript_7858/g.11655 Transcript_7858/m.11655 type:complete len:104 (+) Transcript_7858:579-890(+)
MEKSLLPGHSGVTLAWGPVKSSSFSLISREQLLRFATRRFYEMLQVRSNAHTVALDGKRPFGTATCLRIDKRNVTVLNSIFEGLWWHLFPEFLVYHSWRSIAL